MYGSVLTVLSFSSFKSPPEGIFSFLFESKEGREGERNIDLREEHLLVVCRKWPDWDWTRILGMCPDWELNRHLLGYEMVLQPTEPPWPGQLFHSTTIFCQVTLINSFQEKRLGAYPQKTQNVFFPYGK